MRCRVMLGEVISRVFGSGSPIYHELVLVNSIEEPIESHVHGLCFKLLYGFVDNATSYGIVCFDWCGWLWVI